MATDAALSRRDLLAFGLGVAACSRALGQPAERAAYVGVETSAANGLSRARFFSASGETLGRAPLDFRAHGMTRWGARIIVFPRRPGDRFAVIDGATLEIVAVVAAPAGRRFYGHGATTLDGAHLLVAENDLDTLEGRIGVYRLDGGVTRAGEIALPLPGPHEIARHPARDRFFIALGGLQTHPDYGRTPLNLPDFRSQVVTLDFETGALEPMGFWAGGEGVSLRHLAVDGAGRLYVGGQAADPARAMPEAVLWLAQAGAATRLEAGAALGGYVSSVAAHGAQALVSSQRSGAVLRLEGETLLSRQTILGAGAVALGPGLAAAAGFTRLDLDGREIEAPEGFEFDNHGLALG